LRGFVLAASALIALAPAAAQETVTFTYDNKGRLVTVNHGSTGPNAGVNASYTYDNADNRTNVTVSGVAPPPTCVGVSFAIGNASANEGGNLGFTVTKSGTTSDTCTVNYATANGTAVSGTNYTAKSGTLSFASGTASQAVTVATIDDHIVTSALTMKLNLSSPSGSATISTAQGTGTINNIDTSGTTTIQLATGTSENLRTIADANGYTGSSSANFTFVVGSGVTVTGFSGTYSGIDTGSWPAGVTLALQVNGIVRGGGGIGGNGGGWTGSTSINGTNGGAGGDAIVCNAPITITVNSGGTVQAGGGGGAGGGYVSFPGPPGGGINGGGGGGGGAPNGAGGTGGGNKSGSSGSPGAAGTTSGGGAGGTGSGGNGGSGGTYATAGGHGGGQTGIGSPGTAGYAVRKNSTGCTASGAGTITGTVG